MKFLIYSGSARSGNYTHHVAEFVRKHIAQQENVEAELLDPQKLGLDFNDEGQAAGSAELTQKVAAADGYILVAPEYNHGYPGSLKYMLDLNLKEYIHKPVAFVGVSAGPFGGTRVIEQLVQVVRELGMVATSADLNVSNVQSEIENGVFTDSTKWQRRTKKMVDELVWMAQALKRARNV